MSRLEQTQGNIMIPDLGMEEFELDSGFDINAAFQEAVQGIASDEEMVLEEKVRRMEFIVTEGTSEVYRDFVDFRAIASQMEMMCAHDHGFNQMTQGSETLSGFMSSNKAEDGHDHAHDSHNHDDDGDEIDPKTGKKKKKKYSWFSSVLKRC